MMWINTNPLHWPKIPQTGAAHRDHRARMIIQIGQVIKQINNMEQKVWHLPG